METLGRARLVRDGAVDHFCSVRGVAPHTTVLRSSLWGAVTVPDVNSEWSSGAGDEPGSGLSAEDGNGPARVPAGEPGGARSRAHRERELASLYATARALTALDEVDAVLASIVRHAHELLGADITYLSAYDEVDGHLKVRAAEGSVSGWLPVATVPPDVGVAGRILENGAPFWVSDYLADTSLLHDPNFDALARSESLTAMLGVPLRDKDGVFGALFVAERFSRSFEADEVALLSAFADHAAIALVNAHLYDESRRALAEVQEAYAAMERSTQVHEALTRVVLHGGGASDVAMLLVNELGGTVTVYDRQGGRSAVREDSSTGSPPDLSQLRDAIKSSRATGRSVVVSPIGSAGTWHCVTALLAGGSSLGALVLSQPDEPTPSTLQTLERAAQILALQTLTQDAVVEAEERVRGELLAELVRAPRPYSDELLARAAARGLRAEDLSVVLVVESPPLGAAELGRRLDVIAREKSGIAGDVDGSAVMLLSAGDAHAVAQEVHAALRTSLRSPTLVVAASAAEARAGIRRPLASAQKCLRVLRALDVDDRATSTSRLGIYAVLFDPDRAGELREFIAERVGPLLDYDARRGTSLVVTLRRYFDCGAVLTRAAEELHVHMNTLVKRLDRIGRLLGEDWREPHRVLELEVAVRLHELSDDTRRAGRE